MTDIKGIYRLKGNLYEVIGTAQFVEAVENNGVFNGVATDIVIMKDLEFPENPIAIPLENFQEKVNGKPKFQRLDVVTKTRPKKPNYYTFADGTELKVYGGLTLFDIQRYEQDHGELIEHAVGSSN